MIACYLPLSCSWNDLKETVIDYVHLIWFTDGSHLKDEQGHYWTGYANFHGRCNCEFLFTWNKICLTSEINCSNSHLSIAKDQAANIYTDRCCALGVEFMTVDVMEAGRLLTSSGQSIQDGKHIAELLDTLQKLRPRQLSKLRTS